MRKLKRTEVPLVRAQLLTKQGGRCAICKGACAPAEAVLDHDHMTGAIRAVLHRACNALLGKVENNFKRYGVKDLQAWAMGMPVYLKSHGINRTGMIHPLFRTETEKRALRNARARRARAKRSKA